MTTYTPAKPVTIKDILFSVLLLVVITAFVIVIDSVFRTNYIRHTNYFTVSLLLVIYTVEFLLTNRVKAITFDEDKRELLFTCKNFLSRPQQKKLLFEHTRIEVRVVKSRKTGDVKTRKLFLMKNKMEVLEISVSKDGYNSETLQAIARQAEQFGIPLINL